MTGATGAALAASEGAAGAAGVEPGGGAEGCITVTRAGSSGATSTTGFLRNMAWLAALPGVMPSRSHEPPRRYITARTGPADTSGADSSTSTTEGNISVILPYASTMRISTGA